MVTNNKVLTVSYGTFSCTLEGFDDSFDTMKAIAEYFRDLAADDRYFGAEPPTPDAEMLTRIAEREIERRVQARHEAGAIVLSATPTAAQAPADDAQPETEATDDIPQATPQDEPTAEAEPAFETAAPAVNLGAVAAAVDFADPAEEATGDAEVEEVEEFDPAATDDTVHDILEASVEDMPTVDAVADAAADIEENDFVGESVSEDDIEQQAEDAASAFFAEADDSADDADLVDVDEEDTVNLFEDAFPETETVSEAAEETEAEEAPEEDSIAAKLRRIRAVVSRADTSDDDDEDYTEDQHADVSAPIELSDDILDAVSVSQVEAQDDADEVVSDTDDQAMADESAQEAIVDEEETPKPRARVIRMKRAQLEEAVAEGVLEEDTDEDEAIAEAATEISTDETAPATNLSDEDEADLMAELAEVDAELGMAEPEVDAEDSTDSEDLVVPDMGADDELVSAEATEDDDVEAEDFVSAKRKERQDRRAKLNAGEPGDEAVDRLIEETNTKLDEPDGSRRRSAIAHLRAAVAATKAEKEAGKSFEKEDVSEAYRDDLANTVHQRQTTPTEQPKRAAPPLKLVAEQRIDTPQDSEPKGIRPRRVSVDQAAAEANAASSNFVEFAENMGATQLPEVLEAAASYLTFVEGRKKFSRPMLMRLAYQVGDDRFEREAGLRSFGQLLRDKKIEKISGGRFTVSEAINFKPDDRAVG